MGSRAARTSAEHVQALNLIDLLFRRKAETIIDAWEIYREHLYQEVEKMTPGQLETWTTDGNGLFTATAFSMI